MLCDDTIVRRCWWNFDLCAPSRLVFFDIGQSLLVYFGLCAPTRFIFFDIDQSLLVDLWLVRFHSSCFFILFKPFDRQSRVIQPKTGWCYTFFRTVAAKKLGRIVQTALSRCSLSRVIQPTPGWGYTFLQAI